MKTLLLLEKKIESKELKLLVTLGYRVTILCPYMTIEHMPIHDLLVVEAKCSVIGKNPMYLWYERNLKKIKEQYLVVYVRSSNMIKKKNLKNLHFDVRARSIYIKNVRSKQEYEDILFVDKLPQCRGPIKRTLNCLKPREQDS